MLVKVSYADVVKGADVSGSGGGRGTNVAIRSMHCRSLESEKGDFDLLSLSRNNPIVKVTGINGSLYRVSFLEELQQRVK